MSRARWRSFCSTPSSASARQLKAWVRTAATNASLSAKWRYGAIGLQPTSAASRRIDSAASPSSRNSLAAASHSRPRIASRSSAERARVDFGSGVTRRRMFTPYAYCALMQATTPCRSPPAMTLPAVLRDRLRLPVIGSPLFIISGPELVIAQCKAGIVGSFPSLNARPLSQLDEWLAEITETLAAHDLAHPEAPSAPFAVNQIVHRTNNRLEEDVELCAKYKVPVMITSLGAREDVNDAAHAWGGVVLHDVINDRFARKAIEKGADGLIPVAAGAGGHAGGLSPFAFVQELRAWFDGPIALSGAIANGGAILAAQAMGADLAYIGSAFIATKEANAAPGYKDMIVERGG